MNRIQLKDKKKFIKWFLESFQMKRRESLWILNYLLNHDIVLNKTKFVENVHTTPRGIRMATAGVEDPSFHFYKDGVEYSDPEKAFHEVRLNWHSDLYIELVFPDSWMTEEFISIVEDNPFSTWNEMISDEFSERIDNEIDRFQLVERRDELLEEIDSALSEDQRDSFIVLTKELKEVEDSLEKLLPNNERQR